MQIKPTIAALILAFVSMSALAATDRNYYVVDSTIKQRFDIFNDGKNTYIEAIPGLVVRGATVDGNQYIVYGVPSAISAQLNGRDITLTRGTPPAAASPTRMISRNADDIATSEKKTLIGTDRTVKAVSTAADAPPNMNTTMQWSVKPSHHSLQQIIEDWASKVGVEVFFKTRDFPLNIKAEKVVSTGDFWAALTLLGESYRHSDAPFQIEPTDFKQIVVHPMRGPKAGAAQQNNEVKN